MDDTHSSHQEVRASVWFLEEKDLYATVKPYSLAFTPEAQIPRENIDRKERSVPISDLRNYEQIFSLDRNGFMVLEFQDEHDEVDWSNETRVKDMHYSRVISEVERVLPESRCVALHHQVSSRWCGGLASRLYQAFYDTLGPKTTFYVSIFKRERLHLWPTAPGSSCG